MYSLALIKSKGSDEHKARDRNPSFIRDSVENSRENDRKRNLDGPRKRTKTLKSMDIRLSQQSATPDLTSTWQSPKN